LFLFFHLQNFICDAQDKDLYIPHEFLFGLNVTQCAVGDFELYTMYCISERQAITIGAGYDANFLDFGRHLEVDDQMTSLSSEENSNEAGRYFWGEGPSFRLIYDFAFSSARDNQNNFLSASAIVKARDYSEYYFGAGVSHSESAQQMIYGLTFCLGKNIRWKSTMLHLYAGTGFRHLESRIHWPENPHYTYLPEKNFTYRLTIPSLEFGAVIFFATKSKE
jgi:hypothetical protein